MTASGYEQDRIIKDLTDRLRRLELRESRNKPASGITVPSPGGFTPPLTGPSLTTIIQEILDLIGAPGSFLTVVDGGGETVFPLGSLGSTETVNLANGNWQWGTLNADCTFTFTTIADTAGRWFILELIEDGTGGWDPTWPGSVVWLGGSAPTHDTTLGTTSLYMFGTRNGGTTWIGAPLGGGGSSPLTTKGDLYTYSTLDARLAVGANDYLLRADSTQTTGMEWVDPQNAGHYELLMDGGSPPEPLDDGTGFDWLYAWVPG